MRNKIKLSVLDQSSVRSTTSAAGALEGSIALTKVSEKLGYHKYWLAEHHSSDGIASISPEILIKRIVTGTSSIRVGSGGIMLSHCSPCKVTEIFRISEAMFPGRIDLGIGVAPNSNHTTTCALAYGGGQGAGHFPTMVSDLYGLLTDSLPAKRSFGMVKTRPHTNSSPPVWMLDSSDYSAAYAAHLSLAFYLMHFVAPFGDENVARAFQEQFQSAGSLKEPSINFGAFVMCAETDEKVETLMASGDLFRLRADKGDLASIPLVDEALSYRYTQNEREYVLKCRVRTVQGSPKTVKSKILELSDYYKNEEFLITNVCPEFEARQRSYEILAETHG